MTAFLGRLRRYSWAAAMIAALVAADSGLRDFAPLGPFLITDAQARVGQPLTPGSAAGVARRTTRRTIRRTAVYVSALPRGCTKTSINGTAIWRCGGTYYQSYSGRYVVVHVD